MPTKKKPAAESGSERPKRKAAPRRRAAEPAAATSAGPLAADLEALLAADTPTPVSVPPNGFTAPPSAVPDAQRVSLDVDTVHDAPASVHIKDALGPVDMPIDHAEPIDHLAHPVTAPPIMVGGRGQAAPSAARLARPSVHLSLYRKLATTFIGLAVLLLGFVLYLSFARATVAVTRSALPVSTTFTVSVAPEPKDAQTVPGAVLETVAEGTKTVAASGEKQHVEGKACGKVTIVNTQTKAQALVATTRLLSPDNVLFRLQQNITVPANGRLETTACADVAGASGDIDPTRFTIPGLAAALQEKTYGVSTESMTGGDREVSVITQAEVDAAVEAYSKEIAAQAAEKLKQLLSRPEVGSGVFSTQNVVRRETTAKVGESQDSYAITVAIHVEAVFYDKAAVAHLAEAQLRAAMPGDKELRGVNADTLDITLAAHDPAAKSATLTVKAMGDAVLKETSPVFDRDKMTGMTAEELSAQLRSAEGIESVDITLAPAWTKRLPNLADHIDLELK